MLAAGGQERLEWEAMVGKRCRFKHHCVSWEEEPGGMMDDVSMLAWVWLMLDMFLGSLFNSHNPIR